MKPTFEQMLLLGTERLNDVPAAVHPLLEVAWRQLDWAASKETAFLEASALAGAAISAGASTQAISTATTLAADETHMEAPAPAIALLQRLLTDEWRSLLPEWLELCASRRFIVPPFFLPPLLQAGGDDPHRDLLGRVVGRRGLWLAKQNSDWAWLHRSSPADPLDNALWETGAPDERIAWLEQTRRNDPADARAALEKTWADEAPDFRLRALTTLSTRLSPADEPFLAQLLKERRKDVRQTAQSLLAALPESGLALRMRERADRLLVLQRSFLSKKIEVTLPASFDASWQSDAIDEKPPAGMGEKAFWARQILGLVPVSHWAKTWGLDTHRVIELATNSSDWADLLLGAWFRSAALHRDAGVSAAIFPALLAHPQALPQGTPAPAAVAALLPLCDPGERWKLAASNPEIAWHALPHLEGEPALSDARAVFAQLAKTLRDGYSPGGTPGAVLAARRMPVSLRDEASVALMRENGLSKPAEAFLQALELRTALHTAFSS
jgi:hypothetical protein